MRFKGTFVLLSVCAGFLSYIYFYEIKGEEGREKAEREEKKLWQVESSEIAQIELISREETVTAMRTGENEWKITAPRELEADSSEFERLATSAADLSRESIIEEDASDLSRFGLDPAETSLRFKTKDDSKYEVRFGKKNPTGDSTYASLEGSRQVYLLASYNVSTFDKKLQDLRERSILRFDQFETRAVDLKTEKGLVRLEKEEDQWWIQGEEKWAADSSSVNSILGALSNTKLEEFFEEQEDDYRTLGFNQPLVDVKLEVGDDRSLKRLVVGWEKTRLVRKAGRRPKETKVDKSGSELYIARDESRTELFFVDKEFVDKLLKSRDDLRDRALVAFQRWDIDGIELSNANGNFTFAKEKSSGDWLLGEDKKKTKWDAVNGILDALEKSVTDFVDRPGSLSKYGLDTPTVRVVLKQGDSVQAECAFGAEGADGVYAKVKDESAVKIVVKDVLEKLNQAESEFLEQR